MSTSLKNGLLLLALTLIWGTAFILIKRSLELYSPLQVACLRILSAGLVLMPMAVYNIRKIGIREWPIVLLSGFLGSLIPAFLFAFAQQRVESATAGVLSSFTPIFTLLITVFLLKKKTLLRQKIGIVTGLLGAFLLSISGHNHTIELNFYSFFILLATACYAINLNVLKFALHRPKPFHIACGSLLGISVVAAVTLLGFSDFVNVTAATGWSNQAFLSAVVLGVSATGMALILFNVLLKTASPVFASSVTYLIPIVALCWGVLDGESLEAIQLFGVGVILAGVFLVK